MNIMTIQEIIASLTLEEKAALCSGQDFWHLKPLPRFNIPHILVTDGPHGLRKQTGDQEHVALNSSVPATCFPTAATTACSWDRVLMREIGVAMAEECLQEEVSVILGPAINIKRSPLCGRNFEYISEDPFLTGEMGAALVDGVQSLGVGTSVKHYAANNQETRRMAIDSVIDERAFREIYLAGFETVIKRSQPWTVMGAYNKIDGTYCCENSKLLNDILRTEWGFDGLVVTDWGACNDRVAGLKAGLDLEMPGPHRENEELIIAAVKDGKLDEALLDRTVERLLQLILKSVAHKKTGFHYDAAAHHTLARKAAAQSLVLLKNDGPILPLTPNTKIAVIGEFARKPRYQGAGSSLINPSKLDNVYDELRNRGINFGYSPGYDVQDDEPDSKLIADACQTAEGAEVVLVLAGLIEKYESEAFDRAHMRLPESHNQLIQQLAEQHPNVVVILLGGSPVEVPWVGQVKGLLQIYLGGQAGALALVDALFGVVNPSGKLAESYPLTLEDNPSHHYFANSNVTAEYRESIYVGYRYYDTAQSEVRFPFGYGLSYSRFEYLDIHLSKDTMTDTETVTVRVAVKNTGAMAGAEIVQLYVSVLESAIFRPTKELKGFDKVFLQPGEQKTVEFLLDKRAFAYYNVHLHDWHIEEGKFEIQIGASSKDIRLKTVVFVKSSQVNVEAPDYRKAAPSYYNLKSGGFEVGAEEFKAVYGRDLPPAQPVPGQEFTMNS
ncbi:MAG TPA: glycoside hydrolase family 3 C-terminal domain-containing protein, partial [Bacillota bacterium]|nr:glycoside hydrolase family 3 C-terminal domain-containing protein [Bacillota bacterium]